MAVALYKALALCHIGGLRQPGDVFRWPRFDPCPKHLQELGAEGEAATAQAAPAKVEPVEAPGPTPADIEAATAQAAPAKVEPVEAPGPTPADIEAATAHEAPAPAGRRAKK